MKFKSVLLVLCIVFFMSVSPAFAQRKHIIKIASVAPESTPYGAALNKMAADWAAATNGEVEVRIYHNGVAGTEEDIIRKIKLNQLQGGVLTTFGLNIITPEMLTICTPFTIRSDDELNAVIDGLRPTLEKKIEDNGFVSIAWAKAGWIKIFSKRPVFTPSDLKSHKLTTDPSEPKLTQAFNAMGFNVVPVHINDILMALNQGMADAFYNSPLLAGGLQIFALAKNMATINICPVMGGIVLSENTWRRIPDQYKSRLLEINKRMEAEMNASILQLEEDAVKTMSSLGLVINTISPAQEQVWYNETEAGVRSQIGSTFDKPTYDHMMSILSDYRSKH
jgi:TRAP-type C4-dicarboxylate transport system substrate-binding protein